MKIRVHILLLLLTILSQILLTSVFARDFNDIAKQAGIPIYTVDIISEIPHSTQSFTQGLIFTEGALYESTGLYGQSTLQKLDVQSGKTLKIFTLPETLFGEGLAQWKDKLIQLTWQEHTALVYQQGDFTRLKSFSYPTEGWGLTTDGKDLFMSDGSALLYRRDPENFALEDTVVVRLGEWRLVALNELEFAQGKIYANLLGLDDIVELDPSSGQVTAVVDASPLRDRISANPTETPLNGIAFDSVTGSFFVTGKLWPAIFQVRFVRGFEGK